METEEENDARVQEQRPPFTGLTQQTVYQHESHMTAAAHFRGLIHGHKY